MKDETMIAAAMGWIGTMGGIGAYLLLSRGRWQASSLRYSALNGMAGILAGSASVVYGTWPSVASNLVWTAIAAHSALVELRARRSAPSASVEWRAVRDHDWDPPTGPQPALAHAA